MSAILDATVKTSPKTYVSATDIPHILDAYASGIKVLSLDCFDTLLWRQTATPKDIFYILQENPVFKQFGVTAHQRISAAARTYREKFITHGHHQIRIEDIYARFTALTSEQQKILVEEEVKTEMEMCYAFLPMVDLIRKAHAIGLKIIIVSDIYLSEAQLRRLLAANLPSDVMQMIAQVFCSVEHATAKSDNLFGVVQQALNEPAGAFLHIGDHAVADFEAPTRLGMHALHFRQFDDAMKTFLQLQHTAGSLVNLSQPNAQQQAPRYNPFRSVFTMSSAKETPEQIIGYQSFGPILYAFAKFVVDETTALRAAGKKLKVFFLLRDAYLLEQACTTYAGESLGKLVRIRKFVTVAASFRTQADVDHYLSSIAPEHFNFWVICEQLLLPREIAEKMIQFVHSTATPEKSFYQLLHQPNILTLIFSNSAAYRQRLKRYITKEMQLEAGDTVVLVDTGYIGVTQEFLARTFKDDLQVDITGLYFIGSHEPDRPNCKSLFTTTWCDHGLFEQTCTYQEGAVLDYDNDGNPVFDKVKLSDAQYAKVRALQQEAIRFVRDARQYLNHLDIPFYMLKNAALAALKRHIFFPTSIEIAYFQTYQHDKDMGVDGKKTMFNLMQGQQSLRQHNQITKLHPYEARTLNLNLTLSALLQRTFSLDFTAEPLSLQSELIKMVLVRGAEIKQVEIHALNTHDGYYMFSTPAICDEQIGILFGASYEWLQIDSIKLLGNMPPVDVTKHLLLDQMTQKNGNLFECTENGLLILTPLPNNHVAYSYQFVFRPLVKR